MELFKKDLKADRRRIDLAATDVAALFVCTLFFAGWITAVTKEFSWQAVVLFAILNSAYLLAGGSALRLLSVGTKSLLDFPVKYLLGYFLINASLFVLALVTPFPIIINFSLTLLLILGIWVLGLFLKDAEGSSGNSIPSLLWLFVALLGTTLWARDSFNPIIVSGDSVTFTTWVDSFVHAMLIRIFAESHGAASLQSCYLAGFPPLIYHYASYMAPALLTASTGIAPFDAYNGFAVPGGLFITIMAAYVLVCSSWGRWPGFAGSLCLLLLPNASYHGLNIPWFSYHWLILISPSLAYGIAVFAIAWVLMFEGLRKSRPILIMASYSVACLSLAFKAYLFLSFSLMVLVYPLLFWKGLSLRSRLVGVFVASAVFLLAIEVSHHFESVSFIHLNFSGASKYSGLVISQVENRSLLNTFVAVLGAAGWILVPLGALLIYWGTFGVFGVVCPALAFVHRREIDPATLWFPLLTMVAYLIMSLGLGYDTHLGASSEHFLHRHFTWAYFVVCSWTLGAAYWIKFGADPPSNSLWRAAMVVGLSGLLFVSYSLGHKVQVGPVWGKFCSWTEVPHGLVQASFYIRDHSRQGDIVQDSKNDPKSIVSGLSGRQAFLIDYWLMQEKMPPLAFERLAGLRRFKALTSEDEILSFASKHGIKWYILHPDDEVHWPQHLTNKFVFHDGGFRVYNFQNSFPRRRSEIQKAGS